MEAKVSDASRKLEPDLLIFDKWICQIVVREVHQCKSSEELVRSFRLRLRFPSLSFSEVERDKPNCRIVNRGATGHPNRAGSFLTP